MEFLNDHLHHIYFGVAALLIVVSEFFRGYSGRDAEGDAFINYVLSFFWPLILTAVPIILIINCPFWIGEKFKKMGEK